MQVPVISQPSTDLAPLGGEHVPRRIASTEETFGGGEVGFRPDLRGLADVAGALYAQQKRRTDQVATLSAAGQVSTLETSLAEHAKSQLGMNAYHAVDDVTDAWQKGTAAIGATLANDDQRAAFQTVVQSHWNSLNSIFQTHVSTQHLLVAAQAVDGYTRAEANAALVNYTDPQRVDEAVANTRAAITQYGASEGQDPTYTKVHADEAVSKIHSAVIARMVGSVGDGEQPEMAAKYFKAHQAELLGPEAAKWDGLIAKNSVEGAAQQQGDAIVKQATSLQDALTHAALIQDPTLRTKTEERVRRSFEDQATSERQQREKTIIDLNAMLHQNKGDFDALPIEQRNLLTPTEEESLRHNADAIRNPKAVTNKGVQASLLNMAGLHPAQFGALDLEPYRGQLAPKDFNALQAKQLSLRLGERRTETTEAKKAAAEKKKEDAARALLEKSGIHIGPPVPGAPIAKPPAPGQPPTAAVDPKVHALPIPQSWKDKAATDTAYANYLKHHAAPDEDEQDHEEEQD